MSIWIEAARSEQAPGPIKLHHLEIHKFTGIVAKKKKIKKNNKRNKRKKPQPTHLKNEAHIPHALSITFITMNISIFQKCEFIFDLHFMKETII